MQSTTARNTTQEFGIILNGEPARTTALTLADLVEEQGLGAVRVATAVNEEFVPAAARAQTSLTAGDKVEIVSARQGG